MATVKVKFRPSIVSEKEGHIYYRVIHRRVVRQLKTNYKLYPSEWDAIHSQIIISSDNEERKFHLIKVQKQIEKDLKRWREIIAYLKKRKGEYTSNTVIHLYLENTNCDGFISYARRLIQRLKRIGKARTGETYTSAINSFVRFYGNGDVSLNEVDSDLMTRYESYLKSEGLCQNSTSFYMRNLRAIYNRSVEEGITEQHFPFRHVYTGIAKTVKRAISLNDIKRLKEMDLSLDLGSDYARDMFMLSFYMRGMSIIDMAYLRKVDLAGSILSYRRKKTGQQLFIKWEKPMQEILDKYDLRHSPYLLPIIENDRGNTKTLYRSRAHFINRKLKQIGLRLGLPIPLTLYVSRHSWASVAWSKNVPLSVISEAMGHDSEATTQIYLASLDTSAVDKANRLILESL